MNSIYKICPAALWRQALQAGTFAGAPVDFADGYIHFSTQAQLRATLARHFAGQSDLLLVEVDADALGPALRYEPSRGGDLFPHLYSELPISAVISVRPITPDADGAHRLPLSSDGGTVPAFDPELAGWSQMSNDRFIGLVGPLWAKGEGPARRYGFLAEAKHLNRGGIVHGGMIMTFADQALGMAAWMVNRDRRQVTAQLDTHFIDGVREGEFVEARSRIVRETRSLIFLSVDLVVGERVIAAAQGVWKMLGLRRDNRDRC